MTYAVLTGALKADSQSIRLHQRSAEDGYDGKDKLPVLYACVPRLCDEIQCNHVHAGLRSIDAFTTTCPRDATFCSKSSLLARAGGQFVEVL